jgi:hypothetical protein
MSCLMLIYFDLELRSKQSMLFSFLGAMNIFNGLKWSGRKADDLTRYSVRRPSLLPCSQRLHGVVLEFKRG